MRQKTGFTIVELILVFAILGLIAALVVPSVLDSGELKKAKMCRSNLSAIRGYKTAINKDLSLWDINEYVKTNLFCPSGGKYNVGYTNESPSCSLAIEQKKMYVDPRRADLIHELQ